MKIIHVPFCFHPDRVGGTEVYVESLAREMRSDEFAVLIAAPGQETCSYEYRGLSVRRYRLAPEIDDLRQLYGEGDLTAAQEFAKILDEEYPDIVHLHAFTRGVSLRLAREARQRGIKVVFTYHTPTVSCQRGTLMRWGTEVCDGILDVSSCSACTLEGLGINKRLALLLGSLPHTFSSLPGKFGLSGGLWTALRMSELVQVRQLSFHRLMEEADHVVALCEWTRDLLLRNGVPAGKITLSRHGLPNAAELRGQKSLVRKHSLGSIEHGTKPESPGVKSGRSEVSSRKSPLRIAFLGRLDPAKGADLLIRAVRSLPLAALELHLYGIAQDNAGTAHLRELEALAEGDPRIRFLLPVPSHRTIELLKEYDVLALPSRLLETGPLVVLEAFAAGVPVLGSRAGGIAESVREDIDGLLVDVDSVAAWADKLRCLVDDAELLLRLRAGIRYPRTMRTVAEGMAALYRRLVNPQAES